MAMPEIRRAKTSKSILTNQLNNEENIAIKSVTIKAFFLETKSINFPAEIEPIIPPNGIAALRREE